MKLLLLFSSYIFSALFLIATGQEECSPDQFHCPNTTRCIPRAWVCDGDLDCPGGEDEDPVGGCPPCRTNEFECDDGSCIPFYDVCDKTPDCPNGEDELNCTCKGLVCKDGGECIPEYAICDGRADCPDGEDEHPEGGCPPCDGFECKDGECIPSYFVCDGDLDCSTGEDELGCPCDGFSCLSGGCVPESYLCDGEADCLDASDEYNCTCKEGEVDCGRCIPPYWLCDYIPDCPGGADEENCNYTMTAVPSPVKLHKLTKKHNAILFKKPLKTSMKNKVQAKGHPLKLLRKRQDPLQFYKYRKASYKVSM